MGEIQIQKVQRTVGEGRWQQAQEGSEDLR